MDMEDIARSFLKFDACLSLAPVGQGNINDSYRLEVSSASGMRQSYLLQRLNHQVFKNPDLVMRNMQMVADYLQQQAYSYQISTPLTALDGQYLQRDDAGNYWRLFPFFENTFAPEGIVDQTIAYEAARAYGAFAAALRDFPAQQLGETIPGFHDTQQRWAYFLQVLEQDPVGRAGNVRAEIDALFGIKPLFDKIQELRQVLPLRVTHNDTKAGNVLMDRNTGKAIAVIDWDTVMPGLILSDFGDMVRTFVPNCPEDAATSTLQTRQEIMDALLEGFLSETENMLTAAEKTQLPLGGQWMTGEQALRFLTDYLAGDVYFKVKDPEHNLRRTQNQLRLLQLLQEN
jgi:Ser/Thr protein kinase RdoA (MazF antagonist)